MSPELGQVPRYAWLLHPAHLDQISAPCNANPAHTYLMRSNVGPPDHNQVRHIEIDRK